MASTPSRQPPLQLQSPPQPRREDVIRVQRCELESRDIDVVLSRDPLRHVDYEVGELAQPFGRKVQVDAASLFGVGHDSVEAGDQAIDGRDLKLSGTNGFEVRSRRSARFLRFWTLSATEQRFGS